MRLVDGVSFGIEQGKTLALIGESGSGKTLTSLALARMLPNLAIDSGDIRLGGKSIVDCDNTELERLRGKDIGYIFQEPLSALNPLHKVRRQIVELLTTHHYVGNINDRVTELLTMTGLDVHGIEDRYPHQLSGGQRQRVMIAMALANSPDVLIADEPTTALDRKIQWQILDLLRELQQRVGLTLLLISHDLHLVRQYADSIVIMRHGQVVEAGITNAIYDNPQEDYTKMLLQPLGKQRLKPATMSQSPILKVDRLSIAYPVRKGIFKRIVGYNSIVSDISFTLHSGETIGLVGPSGSGKSSIALAVLRLIQSKGSIAFLGQAIDQLDRHSMRSVRKDMQIVFQDPFASLNPRMTLFQIIREGLAIHITSDRQQQRQLVTEALEQVDLDKAMIDRFAHELSGGQRQRVAVARTLVMKPKLVILDEPTSSLDRSTQRQILTLLTTLQRDLDLAYICISHDQEAIDSLSHKVIELDVEQSYQTVKE